MSMLGSTFVLARTAAERASTGDPRPSVEERYRGPEDYLDRVRQATAAMIEARHLLAEDADAVMTRAGLLWEFIHGPAPREE